MSEFNYRADVLSNGDVVLIKDALGTFIQVMPDGEKVVKQLSLSEEDFDSTNAQVGAGTHSMQFDQGELKVQSKNGGRPKIIIPLLDKE